MMLFIFLLIQLASGLTFRDKFGTSPAFNSGAEVGLHELTKCPDESGALIFGVGIYESRSEIHCAVLHAGLTTSSVRMTVVGRIPTYNSAGNSSLYLAQRLMYPMIVDVTHYGVALSPVGSIHAETTYLVPGVVIVVPGTRVYTLRTHPEVRKKTNGLYRFRALFPKCPTTVFRWEITLPVGDTSTLSVSAPCTDIDQLRMVGTMIYVNPSVKTNYEYPIVVQNGTGLLVIDFVEADELQVIPSPFSFAKNSIATYSLRKSWLFSCPETMHVKLNYGFSYLMVNQWKAGAGLWFDFEGLDVEERHSYLVVHTINGGALDYAEFPPYFKSNSVLFILHFFGEMSTLKIKAMYTCEATLCPQVNAIRKAPLGTIIFLNTESMGSVCEFQIECGASLPFMVLTMQPGANGITMVPKVPEAWKVPTVVRNGGQALTITAEASLSNTCYVYDELRSSVPNQNCVSVYMSPLSWPPETLPRLWLPELKGVFRMSYQCLPTACNASLPSSVLDASEKDVTITAGAAVGAACEWRITCGSDQGTVLITLTGKLGRGSSVTIAAKDANHTTPWSTAASVFPWAPGFSIHYISVLAIDSTPEVFTLIARCGYAPTPVPPPKPTPAPTAPPCTSLPTPAACAGGFRCEWDASCRRNCDDLAEATCLREASHCMYSGASVKCIKKCSVRAAVRCASDAACVWDGSQCVMACGFTNAVNYPDSSTVEIITKCVWNKMCEWNGRGCVVSTATPRPATPAPTTTRRPVEVTVVAAAVVVGVAAKDTAAISIPWMYVGIGAGALVLVAVVCCWVIRRKGTAKKKTPEIADKQMGDTWLSHASNVVDDLNQNSVQKIRAEPEEEMHPMGDVMGRATTRTTQKRPPPPNFQLKKINLYEVPQAEKRNTWPSEGIPMGLVTEESL